MKNVVKLEKAQEEPTKIIKEVVNLYIQLDGNIETCLEHSTGALKMKGIILLSKIIKSAFPGGSGDDSIPFFCSLSSFFPQKPGVGNELQRHTGAH